MEASDEAFGVTGSSSVESRYVLTISNDIVLFRLWRTRSVAGLCGKRLSNSFPREVVTTAE